MEQELKELKAQFADLNRKYEDATGRKAKTTKKITVPVTEAEYQAIHRAAFEASLPKGRYLRELLGAQKHLPALAVKP